MTPDVDALVAGGGPAGSTIAGLLARAGWSVLLVERQRFPRRKVCGEYLSGTSLPVLDQLGVGARFVRDAGPEVRRVGLFARSLSLAAPLPRPDAGWGRALARVDLDAWLLEQASRRGAVVWQERRVESLVSRAGGHVCRVAGADGAAPVEVSAAVVVAAHGSWEAGGLPTQPDRGVLRASDLLGFKAHLEGTSLPHDLMPLLAFPGGYGGMVHVGDGVVSLSCCVRRDRLERLRRDHGGSAGDAVLEHIQASCRGAQEVLRGARLAEPWLGAGPIRPGIRLRARGAPGILRVGNAAGEAHPVVAEGIGMALQGAVLLAETLAAWRQAGASREALAGVATAYARGWCRRFALRVRASAAIARWAMSPWIGVTLPLVRAWPGVLTWGARCAGKATDGIQRPRPLPLGA